MISEIIEKWIKGILIDGITGNLSGLFDNVNAKVGEIASDVGSTPQAWNSGIFNMLRSLSETVVLPIAAAILALVMCHELIQMITEKNNIDRRTFSKCIAFEDISYQLAQPEARTAIFEHLCDLYNYVDASIHVQLSFLNRKVDPVQYAKSFEIAPQGDDFDDIRAEYTAILQKQLASGNNGIVKTKYLTFTIEADSLKTARARLTRIGLDLLGYFKTMGCVAHVMDGQERLEVLHGIFHPDGKPFRFDWDWLAPSGLSTKDFVAPSSLCFGTAKTFGLGGKYAEKVNGVWEQRLRIHYNCVGTIEIPKNLPLLTPDVSVNTRKGVVVNYAPCDIAI